MIDLSKIIGFTLEKDSDNNLSITPYPGNATISQYEQAILEVHVKNIDEAQSVKVDITLPDEETPSIENIHLAPDLERENIFRVRLNEILGDKLKFGKTTVKINFEVLTQETEYSNIIPATYSIYKTNVDVSYSPDDIDVLFINQNKLQRELLGISSEKVDKTLKINGKTLDNDIVLTGEDINWSASEVKTIKEKFDETVAQISIAKNEAITESNNYTDTEVIKALSEAKNYSNNNLIIAERYTDAEVIKGVNEAKNYADEKDKIVNADAKTYAETALNEAKAYADSKIVRTGVNSLVYTNLEEFKNAVSVSEFGEGIYTLDSIRDNEKGEDILADDIDLGFQIFIRAEDTPDYWLASKISSTDDPLSFFQAVESDINLNDYVKFTDKASSLSYGVVKAASDTGIDINDGIPSVNDGWLQNKTVIYTDSLPTENIRTGSIYFDGNNWSLRDGVHNAWRELITNLSVKAYVKTYETKYTAGDGIKIENNVISLDVENFNGGSF